MVYDGYGAVLTGTMPVTLAQTLLDMPDGTTGLVHLGNGRYYDPALGRPLQPNPAGAPPTVPQALNRYAAAPMGQPGVFQAASQLSLTNLSLAVGAIKSSSAEILARATWGALGQTVRTLHTPGKSIISITASNNFLKKASHIIQNQWAVAAQSGLGSPDRKLYEATFEVVYMSANEASVRAALAAKLSLPGGRWAVTIGVTNTDEVYEVSRIPRLSGINNAKWGFITDVALSGTFQWIEDSYNPHFTFLQRSLRSGTAMFGSGLSTGAGLLAGTAICGPAAPACAAGAIGAVGTTILANVIWSHIVQPWIFQNVSAGFLQPPPRNLQAMTVN